jgi:hypothetical protein
VAAGVLAAALAETAIVTYRDVKSGSTTANPIGHLPVPAQYTSVAIVYGILSFLPDPIGTLMGWGFVVATLLDLWTPGGAIAKPKATPSTTGATP